jgi:hypothetical protein
MPLVPSTSTSKVVLSETGFPTASTGSPAPALAGGLDLAELTLEFTGRLQYPGDALNTPKSASRENVVARERRIAGRLGVPTVRTYPCS